MKDLDQPDDAFQPLGAPVKKPEMPKPYRKVAEGIYQAPNGKWETQIPEPPPTIFDFYLHQQP